MIRIEMNIIPEHEGSKLAKQSMCLTFLKYFAHTRECLPLYILQKFTDSLIIFLWNQHIQTMYRLFSGIFFIGRLLKTAHFSDDE